MGLCHRNGGNSGTADSDFENGYSCGDLPKILGKAFGDIIAHIMELGEQPIGPAFVGYFNMDMERLEFEIGFPVSKAAARKRRNPGRTYPGRETSQLHVQRSLYGNAARL